MRNAALMAMSVLALANPAWAQQNGKDVPADSAKAAGPEPCEIRAYLLDKTQGTINIVGITAVLVVVGKDGKDVLIPLQVITTNTGEKNAIRSSRPPRELEGTPNFVSLIRVPSEKDRRSEAEDADRRLAKVGPQDPAGKKPAAPAESDRTSFLLEGPYFKADLTREQLEAFTCQASVRFNVKGTIHTARGFHCALARQVPAHDAACPKLAAGCAELEKHLQANEMDKARADVDRMGASLSEPCGATACGQVRHGCTSCCTDLRAAVSSGNREKALEALHALKLACSPCASPKTESKPEGERK